MIRLLLAVAVALTAATAQGGIWDCCETSGPSVWSVCTVEAPKPPPKQTVRKKPTYTQAKQSRPLLRFWRLRR